MATRGTYQFLPRKVFHAGKTIFRQGEEGDNAFVIEHGRVEIVRIAGDKRQVLGYINEGGIFGEMALVDDQPRMAEAIAVEDTTCLVIGRDRFREKIVRTDPFIQGLLRIFVRNIRSLTERA
jgi:CRP-like cAMP-binding protein